MREEAFIRRNTICTSFFKFLSKSVSRRPWKWHCDVTCKTVIIQTAQQRAAIACDFQRKFSEGVGKKACYFVHLIASFHKNCIASLYKRDVRIL